MNNKIANIIVDYLKDLTWVDKLAGLTQVARVSQQDGDRKVEKRYPISCSLAFDESCKEGCYDDLMPNSAYRSLMYFEDGGLSYVKNVGKKKYYQSNLRLVCWLNYKKLPGGCGASADYIIDIIKSLPAFPQNIGDMLSVDIQVVSQVPRSNGIFANYTYNELQTQYLLIPYDYFALEIRTSFYIVTECLQLNPEGCLNC